MLLTCYRPNEVEKNARNREATNQPNEASLTPSASSSAPSLRFQRVRIGAAIQIQSFTTHITTRSIVHRVEKAFDLPPVNKTTMLLSTTAARALFQAGSKTALKAVAARGACSVAIGKKKVRYSSASVVVVSSRAVAGIALRKRRGCCCCCEKEVSVGGEIIFATAALNSLTPCCCHCPLQVRCRRQTTSWFGRFGSIGWNQGAFLYFRGSILTF